jgi:small GTP-binding protein
MKDSAKVLITGLDYAGKTSIMIALDQQKGYIDMVKDLTPTVRVEQIEIKFLGKEVIFWDLGGQKKYRELYEKKKDKYFAETDLLIHVIDIQDSERFTESLEYLDSMLNYFFDNYDIIPVVIAFHKSDPEIIDEPEIIENVEKLTENIQNKYDDFELLFQQTSIYNIVSIVKMISYGLAVLNEDFFNLYQLLEEYSLKLNSVGLFLLDRNGMIICKYFKDQIGDEIYEKLEKSVKEHIFELKDKKEKEELVERKLFENGGEKMRSYLHPIQYRDDEYYMSILLDDEAEKS